MGACEFRHDRYLRTTCYNFYSWAVVNILVTVPAFAALNGSAWNGWLALIYTVALITAGVVVSGFNDRRVERMCGEAAPEPLLEALNLWPPVLIAGFLLMVMLGVHNENAYVQPLWMIMIGLAYAIWGLFTIPEYKWLGRLMILSGATAGFLIKPAEVASGLASRTALYIWIVVMGLLWPLVA